MLYSLHSSSTQYAKKAITVNAIRYPIQTYLYGIENTIDWEDSIKNTNFSKRKTNLIRTNLSSKLAVLIHTFQHINLLCNNRKGNIY